MPKLRIRNQGRFAMVGVLDQAAEQLSGTLFVSPPPQRFPGLCAEAIELLEQARTLYRQVGDRNGEAVCIRELADCHGLEGAFPTAINYYNLAIKTFAGSAGQDNAVGSLVGLGRAHQGDGQRHQAEQRLDKAKACFGEAEVCFNQGVEFGQTIAHHRLEEAAGLRRLQPVPRLL